MKQSVLLSASVALVLSLTACERAAAPVGDNAATNGTTATASAADAEAVKKAFADFNAAIAANDLAGIRAQYASDAVMVLPNQKPLEGIDAIMGDYEGFSRDPVAKYVPGAETTYVSSGGDLAYGQVNYETTFTNPETKAVETSTRYNITVYKKQADGSWKIVRDVNTALPKAS